MIKNIIAKIINFIVERFPDRQSLLGVYAVIVFLVYSWTLLISFYKLPSWALFLTTGQILSIYAYAFSVNLAESLFVLLGLLFLDYTIFLLLRNKEEFQLRSLLITVILLGSSMWRLVLFQEYSNVSAFVGGELTWWAVTITLGLPIAIFVPKVAIIRKIMRAFVDRTVIFLYVYLPLSFISLIVVIIRNIY